MARIIITDRFPAVVRRVGDARQAGYSMTCRSCPETGFLARSSERHLPPEIIARKFAERGWEIGNAAGKDRCPACTGKRKAEIKALDDERRQRAAAKESAMSQSITPAASKRITDLYMMLDDAYDQEKRAYKRGWSDDVIAKKLGVSPELVAKRRETDFGPLIVDTTADDIRRSVDDLRQRQKSINSLLTTLIESHSAHSIKLDALAKLTDSLGKA